MRWRRIIGLRMDEISWRLVMDWGAEIVLAKKRSS
jgi:hypothetical protein